MPDHSTETLSDHDLSTLAVLMADDPKFAAKLADMIAEKVGEKLFDGGFNVAGIEIRLDKIDRKLSDHDGRFDTIDQKHPAIFAQGMNSTPESFERSTSGWIPSTAILASTPTRAGRNDSAEQGPGPGKKSFDMKPMLDPKRDLKGATPETLVRALFRRTEPLRSPRPRVKPVVRDKAAVGQVAPHKPRQGRTHLRKGV